MSAKFNKLFSLQEVCIYPKSVTHIISRDECDPTINGTLPLFTAPMSTVINENICDQYEQNNINVILPRTISIEERMNHIDKRFVSFGLTEIEELAKTHKEEFMNKSKLMILIDIANGHMLKMQEVIRELKSQFGSKTLIMCGNIANPQTYKYLSDAGADYIRCGIGGGSGCLTASNTGIFYPMGSLLIECKKIKDEMMKSYKLNNTKKPAYIVADGGMKNYDYIIKALFLGADYAMCGRIFAQSWEAPGQKYQKPKNKANIYENWERCCANSEYEPSEYDYKKIFYGMSTKLAQQEVCDANNLRGQKIKTSEGIVKEINVLYKISGWTENFISYLTSAMSYTDCLTLDDVKEFDNYSLMTDAACKSYNR